MNRLLQGVSILAFAGMGISSAFAQTAETTADTVDDRRLTAVTVTATKRSESAQTIPVTVTALGEQELESLGVSNFNDYLVQLPGVTAGGGGPGQSTIYIRGLASTTPNLTTAGVAGLAPNVALYLDEQPVSQPGRNLDVYAADLERVEVLSGPQGTLFGASSQAGTVRLITNKPVLGAFEAGFDASTSFTDGGEMSNSVEAVINIPVTDNFAVRGVVYTDHAGGYIDNVAGTLTVEDSARFRPAGTVRDNGVVVGPNRAGFQAGADLSGVNFIAADNANIAEDDFNDTTYNGFRISGLYEFNEDWTLLVAHSQQQLDSDGVFFEDPELGDYEVTHFTNDNIDDSYHNTAWTLEGRIGALEAVYTGAYTERTTEQTVDYSDYLFVAQYLPYYICDYSVSYPSGAPTGNCYAPDLYVNSSTETKIQTHELRFNTPDDLPIRATFGAFYSDLELAELNDFVYPGSTMVEYTDGTIGFAPNYPLTNTDVTGEIGSASPGYYSEAGPFPEGVIFRNDVLRTDKQLGVFGEATFDIGDQFSLILGARYYDIEVDLEGSANSSFYNLYTESDQQVFGTNISAQFAPNNPFGAPDTASTDGFIYKVTGQWTPTDDILLYATYSEGFRPGLLNRPGGASGPGGFTVPYSVDTDEVQNYEFGWKTELFDNSLRLNGSAFFVDIQGLQTTIFDPSITNLFFSDNAANAELRGVEGEFTWAPFSVDGLTIAGGFSFLDSEVTEVLTPTNDVLEGSDLAFAPGYQGNIRARYEWDLQQRIGDSSLTAHVMPQVIFSDDSYTDIVEINKMQLDSYVTLGGTLGVTADAWSAELFVTNLTNEHAELSGNFVFDRERVTPMRPRTVGLRFSYDFN
ncbi:TonB-dependent receptor [Ponticaulis sp.]|uniref:TonB-dependent receptor n=1 Tax=Ponticaulis sp. TaxID=2020902 RepID=UPI000B71B8DC|nr:TonB-dependent receptor [Ponticaulis sp.]MAI91586.1 TonB-dependent receptor [Ponticaulis sp.]OUX97540.1 MAG: TonB-dependent receptor [Hyphomonadaceae bacterium TMED5]|tara:strand:+ start:50916 stop:53495 length:2580 start_codon:yes stop_codon:yes gene_type:complete